MSEQIQEQVTEPEEGTEPVTEPAEQPDQEPAPETPVVDDAQFFTFASQKLGREVNAWEELEKTVEVEKIVEKVVEKPIDDDDDLVKTFKKYRKETGRGIEDFMEAQRDPATIPEEDRVRRYLKHKNPYLDADDIDYRIGKIKLRMITEEDEFDAERLDQARESKIEWKMLLAESTQWAAENRNQYLIPQAQPAVEAEKEDGGDKVFESGIAQMPKDYRVDFDGFKYEVAANPANYSNLEKFFENFKKGEQFDFGKFVDMMEFYQNRDSILKAFKENVIAEYMDEQAKAKNNATPVEVQEQQQQQYVGFDAFKQRFQP